MEPAAKRSYLFINHSQKKKEEALMLTEQPLFYIDKPNIIHLCNSTQKLQTQNQTSMGR